jgi:outer membrane protein TolC
LSIQIFYLREVKEMTSALAQLSSTELSHTLKAVSRGDLPGADLEVRRLALTDAENRDRSAEIGLRIAELDLNRVLGIDPSQVLRLSMPLSLASRDAYTAESLFDLAIKSRTDINGIRAMYEGAAAGIEVAKLGRFPLPALSINAARDTGKLRTLGPSVSFNLPIWNRGKGDVSISLATHAKIRAEFDARVAMVRADIATTYIVRQLVMNQLDALRREIAPLIPQVEANVRAAERGDLPLSTANAARLALLDKQIIASELARSVAEYKIALEIAVGRPLESIE